MEYSYDGLGWLSDTIIPDRITDIAPPEGIEKIDGQPYPNFTGYDWVMLRYPSPEPTPLPVPPTPDPITILTPYEFLKRFTSEERKAIKAATLTNPDIDDLWTMFTIAKDIDLRNTDTTEGVNALETAGIIAAGRAAEILTY